METITFTIDARRGSIRADRPLYLAAAYNVLFAGDYAGGTPLLILSNHKGDPVAETRTEDDATTLELDTAELASEFRDSGIVACPGSVTLHLWALDSNNTIAQSDIPVFYSPYYTAPSGTLTKIDTTGPQGERGLQGLNGAGLPTFHIDEDGHLIATSPDPNIIYAPGADGQPDPSKPRWILGNGEDGTIAGHIYYVTYDETGTATGRADLGMVKGDKGDKGDTPEMPSIEPQPTPGSANLVTSGGVAAAIEGVANDAANLYVAKSKILQALAGVGNPAELATIGQVKDFLAAIKNAISYLATAIAAALFIAQPAHGTTLENLDLTNEVYTATEVDAIARTLLATGLSAIAEATTNLTARPWHLASGQTDIDTHGCAHNGPVQIGEGAAATVDTSAVDTNTPIRSVSIAIGAGADARDLANPAKQQAIAIGNQSRAGAVNAIAIGSGVRHADEDDMSGGNAYAAAPQAVSIGYSAKAVAAGAVQIGPGVNETPNSLQFMGVPIVRNGKIVTDGLDTNAVRRMIQVESDRGLMYGSTGSTNGYAFIRMAGYNAAQDSDPEFILAVNSDTNSEYAASFPLYPGSPNRREIYSAQTVDRIVSNLVRRIEALEALVGE